MGMTVNYNESTCYKGIPAGFTDPLKVKKNPKANKVAKVPIGLSGTQ